jgi:hypothetical protein
LASQLWDSIVDGSVLQRHAIASRIREEKAKAINQVPQTVGKLDSLIHELYLAGGKMSEEDQLMVLFDAMPPALQRTLQHTMHARPGITLADFKDVINFEVTQASRSQTVSAFATLATKSCYQCGSADHLRDSCPKLGRGGASKNKGNGGKRGKYRGKGKPNASLDKDGKPKITSISVCVAVSVSRATVGSAPATVDSSAPWLVDPAATHCLTSNRDLFRADSLEPLNPPIVVEGIAGPAVMATHTGKINGYSQEHALLLEFPCMLTDKPIPNIFSTGSLVSKGGSVLIRNNQMCIRMPAAWKMKSARPRASCFQDLMTVSSGSASPLLSLRGWQPLPQSHLLHQW